METLDKLKEIIRSNRLSTRPEYTSGRGAILCDLNGNQLEGIYQGILKEFGKKPAKNFIKMVADIKVMSCTTFLEELYLLHSNDWLYNNKPEEHQANGITIPKNDEGEYDDKSMISGMFGMLAAMTNSGRDETPQIKNFFLSRHGVKPNGECMTVWGYSSDGEERMRYID